MEDGHPQHRTHLRFVWTATGYELREREGVRPAGLGRVPGGAHGRVTVTRPHMDWWPRPQYSLQKRGTVTLPSAFFVPTLATKSKLIVVWTSDT